VELMALGAGPDSQFFTQSIFEPVVGAQGQMTMSRPGQDSDQAQVSFLVERISLNDPIERPLGGK
jgi:hypothetical protein